MCAYRNYLYNVLFLVVCGFVFFAYYPGGFSPDTWTQYNQAVSEVFDDWHPPIMSWVWSKLLLVYNKPQSLFVLHVAMFFLASYLMLLTYRKRSFLWIFFPICPWIVCSEGMIWKDIGMSNSLFLSLAIVHYVYTNKKSTIYYIFSLPFILYAILIRHNAILAIIPIYYYAIKFIFIKYSIQKRAIVALLMLLLSLFAYEYINSCLTDGKHSNPHRVMKIDELSTMSHLLNRNLFAVKKELQDLKISDIPFYQVDKGWDFYNIFKDEDDLLNQCYINSIKKYPDKWILAKAYLFKNFMYGSFPFDYEKFTSDGKPQDFSVFYNSFTFCIKKYVDISYLFLPFFFSRWFWVVYNIFIFIYLFNNNKQIDNIIKMLVVSSLFYILGYALVSPTPDFRFTHWSYLSGTLSLFIIITHFQELRLRKTRI